MPIKAGSTSCQLIDCRNNPRVDLELKRRLGRMLERAIWVACKLETCSRNCGPPEWQSVSMRLVCFLGSFKSVFHSTGAVLPSSRFVAHELARFVRHRPANCHSRTEFRILEVGPGTGPATREICRAMQPKDQLDLVEINEQFVAHLEQCFVTDPVLGAVADRVRIHCLPVEDLVPTAAYDVIVSGLPLNNFAAADVRRILGLFSTWLKPGGHCSFFEYIAIRSLKRVVSFPPREERDRLRGIHEALREFQRNETLRIPIWLNVLPAWVHHVCRPNEEHVPQPSKDPGENGAADRAGRPPTSAPERDGRERSPLTERC